MEPKNREASSRRIPTGVPGLDAVLGGGLIDSGLYLIEGVAGAGKTILASQIAFGLAKKGARVLFMTLIAESHAKLLDHLSELAFFDRSAITQNVVMLSGFSELMQNGLDGLLAFTASCLHEYKPELLILDGFSTAREFSESPRALAKFIHELNTLVTVSRCTTLLLAPLSGNSPHPEHTLVDGLIELQRISSGVRRAREIEVHKLRGGSHLTGRHIFRIDDSGIRVFPRLENIVSTRELEPHEDVLRLTTGIPALDAMMGGGLVQGSTTSLLGSPGVGKTLLGLSFLKGGAAVGERGLYFGFYEAPQRLLAKADGVGLSLSQHVVDGSIKVEWLAPLELNLDAIAYQIDAHVTAHGISRVFIDGIEGFQQAALQPERVPGFLTALSVLLRARGVTTILSEELPIFSNAIDSQALSVSAMMENIVLMRYFELDAELRRLICVMKSRESAIDPAIREYHIDRGGFQVGDKLGGIDYLLGGSASVAIVRSTRTGSGHG